MTGLKCFFSQHSLTLKCVFLLKWPLTAATDPWLKCQLQPPHLKLVFINVSSDVQMSSKNLGRMSITCPAGNLCTPCRLHSIAPFPHILMTGTRTNSPTPQLTLMAVELWLEGGDPDNPATEIKSPPRSSAPAEYLALLSAQSPRCQQTRDMEIKTPTTIFLIPQGGFWGGISELKEGRFIWCSRQKSPNRKSLVSNVTKVDIWW